MILVIYSDQITILRLSLKLNDLKNQEHNFNYLKYLTFSVFDSPNARKFLTYILFLRHSNLYFPVKQILSPFDTISWKSFRKPLSWNHVNQSLRQPTDRPWLIMTGWVWYSRKRPPGLFSRDQPPFHISFFQYTVHILWSRLNRRSPNWSSIVSMLKLWDWRPILCMDVFCGRKLLESSSGVGI